MEFISEGFLNLSGYRPEEYLEDRKCYRDLIHPHDRDYVWNEVQKALLKKRAFTFEWRLITADGQAKWVWEQGVGVYSDAGELVALEGFVTDISEQKKMEMELYRENKFLKARMKNSYKFGNIIGHSKPMQKVYDFILQAADSDANVIVYGESGAGKELVARAIHELSDRRQRRFVAVNCGAIPENLIESEFFGYKKGAFSGATADKPGYLDLADGGTLFLDEVGEINLNMQVKLLRAIESAGHTPVGGNQTRKPDVRIIAATNRDLKVYLRKGLMRDDFYFRIHIIPIYLPPLRERKEDIPLLVLHSLKKFSDGRNIRSIPEDMMKAMMKYKWPGNVRELQNVIHRYLTIGQIDQLESISTEEILIEPNEKFSVAEDEILRETDDLRLQKVLEKIEKRIIVRALEHENWHRGRAASVLGINYRTLMRKMNKYGLISHNL
jgi:PAS domain S-box-containing protein